MADSALKLRSASLYSLYVLLLLLIAYLLNQLDRYTLAIVTQPMAQEIHYGDHGCLDNTENVTHKENSTVTCKKILNETECLLATDYYEDELCKWDYNGQGFEYQIVAGPVFILIYTFTGIFLGFAADQYNRKNLLAFCLMFWSLMTLLTGFVKEYWQLVLLRFGLGFGEAGCTPFAASLIADYFDEALRGSALGVYNWGIYTGYSLSYALGDFITRANILGQGWRWVFIISGIPGLVFGIVIFLTVKEPERRLNQGEMKKNEDGISLREKLHTTIRPFLSPSMILLCLAGSIRNAGGYVWAYNTHPYFEAIGRPTDEIGTYMSVIPLVGGSIGVVLGGFISDVIVKRRGPTARVLVLVASQVLAAPFAAGALFLPAPWAYISLIPSNIIGEMWVGVTLAVVVELVPSKVRTSAVAVYLFIITNIGGNIPLLVPPLQTAFEVMTDDKAESLRYALYILFPGLYVAGAFLFLLTLCMLKRDIRKVENYNYVQLEGSQHDDDEDEEEDESTGIIGDRESKRTS
ncbi:protein spinster homolog 1 [Lingula anatina]|uniref:Protein spinster homolog 1 n=1 Tax=Lingula anatina TaxID=7574 RepID=A0A1S3HS59_LINAN|nr:protein spinster homolog 1 [Lingula anatina]|eukprot:XP_013388870.1 protein spinster homolog 1 [Lingula anatina]